MSEMVERLRAVATAICVQHWNDLPEAVRDGANVSSNAADAIERLTGTLEALATFRAMLAPYRTMSGTSSPPSDHQIPIPIVKEK